MPIQRHSHRTETSQTVANDLRKAATGIPGADEILYGGIPVGKATLISGGPGSGKSVMGMQFLYKGALAGAPGIFVAFEERTEALRQNALTLGWDLAPLEQAGKLFLMRARVDPEAVLSGDFNLKALLAIIEGKARVMGASRIVIDAIDVLLRLFDNPARERNELYALHEWLIDHELTTVMTMKTLKNGGVSSRYEFLDFMADCIIELDQRVIEQISTRRLRVVKYRGSDFGHNEYPFVIAKDGVTIIPITNIELQHRGFGPRVTSGHPRLDTIINGGYLTGSAILIVGAPGVGKTTLACTFVRGACERGEKVLYINFEESREAMVSGMLSPGIDLRPVLKDGTLKIQTAIPEAIGAEEHLLRAFNDIHRFQPKHVVVDAMSACKRMGSEQAAFEYLMRLVTGCKEQGITIIITNQLEGYGGMEQISGIGISSIIDMTIFLNYNQVGGEVNRTLQVMKMRGSKHSNQFREFEITDHGIEIMDVYIGKGGVLTGAARQEQEARESEESRARRHQIKQKERELIQKRALLEAQTASMQSEIEAAEGELEGLRLEQGELAEGREARAVMRGKDTNSARLKSAALHPKRKGGST